MATAGSVGQASPARSAYGLLEDRVAHDGPKAHRLVHRERHLRGLESHGLAAPGAPSFDSRPRHGGADAATPSSGRHADVVDAAHVAAPDRHRVTARAGLPAGRRTAGRRGHPRGPASRSPRRAHERSPSSTETSTNSARSTCCDRTRPAARGSVARTPGWSTMFGYGTGSALEPGAPRHGAEIAHERLGDPGPVRDPTPSHPLERLLELDRCRRLGHHAAVEQRHRVATSRRRRRRRALAPRLLRCARPASRTRRRSSRSPGRRARPGSAPSFSVRLRNVRGHGAALRPLAR